MWSEKEAQGPSQKRVRAKGDGHQKPIQPRGVGVGGEGVGGHMEVGMSVVLYLGDPEPGPKGLPTTNKLLGVQGARLWNQC